MKATALGLLLSVAPTWAANIPVEISGVEIGMTKERLLAVRPAITKKGYWDGSAIDLTRSDLNLFEDFHSTNSIFSSATYGVENNRLVSFALTGYPGKGQESEVRMAAISQAKALWGSSFTPRVLPDGARNGKPLLALQWDKGDHDVIVMLPINRLPNDHRVTPVCFIVRIKSPKARPLKEFKMSDSEKKELFKVNGL